MKLPRLVDALTAAPARIVGLQAPRILEGARADLAIVDPNMKWIVEPSRLRTKGHNSPFLHREVKGRVCMTIAAGRIIFDEIDQGVVK